MERRESRIKHIDRSRAFSAGARAWVAGLGMDAMGPWAKPPENAAAWEDGWRSTQPGDDVQEIKLQKKTTKEAERAAKVTRHVPLLHPLFAPAKSKPWGCMGCKFFQYSPVFTKTLRQTYAATLDPGRHEHRNKCYQLDGQGLDSAEIMVIFDSPTNPEDNASSPFAGGASIIVKRNAAAAGIDPKSLYLTYAVKCATRRVVSDLAPKDAIYCSKFLSQEIVTRKPKLIITLGRVPTALMLGKPDAAINQYQGVPQRVSVAKHETVIYPLWSPHYVQRNDYLAERYLDAWMNLGRFIRGETAVKEDNSLYEVIEDPEEAIALCKRLMQYEFIEVDLETSGLNPYRIGARVSIISLCVSTKRGYAIPYDHDEAPQWNAKGVRERFIAEGLKPLLQRPFPVVKLTWHNGKFDYKWFPVHFGFWPTDLWEDTMLTHYASNENEEHGLKPLSLRHTDMGDYDAELDRVLKMQTYEDKPRYDLVEKQLVCKYAGMDTVACRKLKNELKKHVADQDSFVHALAYQALPAFSRSLTRMEAAGCAIDVPFAKLIMPELAAQTAASYAAIKAEPMVRKFIRDREAAARAKMKKPKPEEVKKYFEFSLASPPQLAELLFDPAYYGHEIVARSPGGGPSTDKETMNELASRGSPIAKRIMEYRLDHSLEHTFVKPIVERVTEQGDSILHANVLLHGTKTGRTSSRDPNLQNIPAKGAGIIKRMYVSRYGADGCIVQVDYSQIELRILAAIANDKGMLQAYHNDEDLHILTACLIFGTTTAEFKALDKEEQKRRRTIAKRVNFGIPYGVGGEGIAGMLSAEGIQIDVDTCRGYIDTFFLKKPRVKAWIDAVHASTQDEEISKSLFGRRRRLEAVRSFQDDVKQRTLRQAVNHPIQSTASDLTMTSLCLMDQEIQARQGAGRHIAIHESIRDAVKVDPAWKEVDIFLTVHDSIMLDCRRAMGAKVASMAKRIMTNILDLAPLVWGEQITESIKPLRRVPIVADAEVGPNWRDAAGVKDPKKDVPLAMHIADTRMAYFDADHKGKWTPELEAQAVASFAALR